VSLSDSTEPHDHRKAQRSVADFAVLAALVGDLLKSAEQQRLRVATQGDQQRADCWLA
jgi:hypothetical protein